MMIILQPQQSILADTLARSLERYLTPGHRIVSTTAQERQESDRIKQRVSEYIQEQGVSYQGFITIQYFSFPEWLAVNLHRNQWITRLRAGDPPVADVEESLRKWMTERIAYLGSGGRGGSVSDQLDIIGGTATGAVLLNAIKDGTSHHKLCIFPDNEPTVPGMTQTMADRSAVLKRGKRPGPGADVSIDYSPELWGEPRNSYGTVGPGTASDTILFHELVHASRDLKGVFSPRHVNIYRDTEEYIAVVLTNIYISDKDPSAPLRGSYGNSHSHGWSKLLNPSRFLDNVQHIDISPRRLLTDFSVDQPVLYNDLAAMTAIPFNPVAQLDREKHPDIVRIPSTFRFPTWF